MRIHWKDTTGSTNADAHAGSHGDVFAADFQTAGRGRLDHRWESTRGLNLMFSAVMDVSGAQPAEAATLPLVVGLAIAKSVGRMFPSLFGRIAIKWPNDVLVDGRKLAGILCERDGDCVIAGVGLNVNQMDFSAELADRATSLAALMGGEQDRDAVMRSVLDSLYAAHERWREGGFAAMHGEFAELDNLKGREVAVLQTDSDAAPISGVCGGVQPDGTLLVGAVNVYAGEAHVMKR